MRLAPTFNPGSPPSFVAALVTSPAPAFPHNDLRKPLSLKSPGSEQVHLGALPSLSTTATGTRSAPMVGHYARAEDTMHSSHMNVSAPRFTSDTLVRPVLPRLMPWADLLHSTTETRKRKAEAEPSSLGTSQDFQTAREGPTNAIDYGHTTKPSPASPAATSSTQRDDQQPRAKKPVKTTRRREQCRENQARYRERQKLKMWVKEEEVACLRELVNLLEAHRSLTRTGSRRDAFTNHVVVELFRRFRNGLSGARMTDPTHSNTAVTTTSRAELSMKWNMARHVERNLTFLKQIAFVRTVLTKDADVGEGLRGPDALLEQCWRYSTLHDHLKLDLLDVKREDNSNSHTERVMVTGRLKVGVTEQTLTDVFPDVPPTLQRKLLGATLSYSLRLRLEFEESALTPLLQVTKLHADLDVLSALLDLLREPADVERVMRHAQISPSGFIGEMVDHPDRI